MKEYQYLIGKIIVAVAIIVAAIIIAQAIGGAGESIRSSLLQCKRTIASTCSYASFSAIIVSHDTESKKLST